MEIRKIKETELKDALGLVWRVFLEFEAPDYSEEGIQEFKNSIDDANFIAKLDLYGAFDNELLGVIATRNLNHIALLFVEGKHHRKGIGKALYKYVCEKNPDSFFTANSSPYAKTFYERLGFSCKDGEQIVNGIRFYPMRNDNIKTNMNNWELALNKFIDNYKHKDYFIGAILTGSYVTGNNNQNSDIDVYIITSNDISWRERGNKLIDGYMIEYFINPIKKIYSYFEQELESYHLSSTMMFVNAKILYDKNDEVKKLVETAKNNISDLNNLGDISDFKYKSNCYSVWDGFDELEAKYLNKEDIDFTYHIFLQRVIDSYFYNKKIPSIPLNKIEKLLKDASYKQKYNIREFPNEQFNTLLLNCFTEKDYDKRFNNAKEIYNYFMKEFNDFDINNYSLRSSAE